MDGPFLIGADDEKAQHCRALAAAFADHVIF
jgi:hypothetical protein